MSASPSDSWLFGTVLFLAIVGGVEAQGSEGEAQTAGAQARTLVAAENWSGAESLLREELDRIGEDPAAMAARAILEFNLAWLKEEHARDLRLEGNRENADEATREAEAAYRRILSSYPKNAQAAINLSLLLERSGQADAAEAPLKEALEAESSKVMELRLALADLWFRQDEVGRARREYEALAEDFPDDLALKERLVFSFRRVQEPSIEEMNAFFETCIELQIEGRHRLASEGMEALVHAAWREHREFAEEALLQWVDQHVREGRLTDEDLRVLPSPKAWDSQALTGISGLLNGEASGWWNEDLRRRHIASGIVRVRGDRLAVAGKIDEAVEFYEKSMALAPGVEEYGEEETPLSGRSSARLAAASRMAQVLHANRDLEGERKQKLDNLLSDLWDEKTERYRAGDREGMRQYHKTLAVIHTDQGPEESERAAYHLNRLLKIEASEARREDRPEKPQPQVHRMLAIGHEKNGEREKASASYLEASKGYLLQRDQRSATTTLEKVEADMLNDDAREDFQRVQSSIRLTGEVLGLRGGVNSEAWRQLERMRKEALQSNDERVKAWGDAHLKSIAQQAEIKAIQTGDKTGAREWEAKRKELGPATQLRLENGAAERERYLRNLRDRQRGARGNVRQGSRKSGSR